TNIYPPSMVGVPGDRISNMGPPTLCIVALCFFQVGLLLLIRPWVLQRLRRPAWARANEVVNHSVVLMCLFHTTGYATPFGLLGLPGYRPPTHPSGAWWAERPIWLVVPLVCTIPVILLFGRQWTRRPAPRPAPTAAPIARE